MTDQLRTAVIAYAASAVAIAGSTAVAWLAGRSRARVLSLSGGTSMRIEARQRWLAAVLVALVPLAGFSYFFFPTRTLSKKNPELDDRRPLLVVNLDANWYMGLALSQNQAMAANVRRIVARLAGTGADLKLTAFAMDEIRYASPFYYRTGKREGADALASRYFSAAAASQAQKNVRDSLFTNGFYWRLVGSAYGEVDGLISILNKIEEVRSYRTGERKVIKADVFVVTVSKRNVNVRTCLDGAENVPRPEHPRRTGTGNRYGTYILFDDNGSLPAQEAARLERFVEGVVNAENKPDLSKLEINFGLDRRETAAAGWFLVAACVAALVCQAFFDSIRIRLR
ncbi:MAG: hypothetical protein NT080_09785 [Spirochaetes bacterium]|nr:hypothetical protein [Spirochaetota bacterium]